MESCRELVVDGVAYRAFDHLFSVSADGQVLRGTNRYTPTVMPSGYARLGRRLMHRVVATCWCARPEGATQVHHKDGNRANNRADNLEWVTPKQHMGERHAETVGKHRVSDTARENLRILRTGTKASEATKQKQREASLRLGLKPPPRPIGTKCSEHSKALMRLRSPNACSCEVHGVVYRSFSEAGAALGIKLHTLRKRCLSEKFPDYRVRE